MRGFGPTSYGEAFADVYDDWYHDISDVDATVRRLAELADGGPVLELGAGTGRLALPLTAAGCEVWALDASAAMLAALAAKPGAEAVRPVLGDMAAPPLRAPGRFRVVFCAYNTFLSLDRADAQAACLAWVAEALADDGHLVLEAFVPADDADAADDHPAVTVRTLEADRVVLSVAQRDREAQVVTGQFVELAESGVRLRPYRVRYLHPHQLDDLAAEAGLALVERWADWSGAPFTGSSTEHVSRYRRRPGP